jgi:hypothetical protein
MLQLTRTDYKCRQHGCSTACLEQLQHKQATLAAVASAQDYAPDAACGVVKPHNQLAGTH